MDNLVEKIDNIATQPHRVVILLLPQVNLLDLAGPAQVFHSANTLGAHYQLEFCGLQNSLATAQGLNLNQLTPLSSVQPDDLILVPGLNLLNYAPYQQKLDPTIGEWLRQAAQSGTYITSVCTGAFILGEAGLLNKRRCTTHWAALAQLQSRYPQARVVDDALFVHDANVTTSAGIAAGIDMALSIVERDYGPLFTAQLARYLVVYLRRDGTQSQTSIYLEYRTHLQTSIHQAQDYLINHLTRTVSLAELAEEVGMSIRSLSRAFKEATGLTPIEYHQRLRLDLASNLLNNPALSIETVAAKAGFEDARHLRRLWQRYFGISPSSQRLLRRS